MAWWKAAEKESCLLSLRTTSTTLNWDSKFLLDSSYSAADHLVVTVVVVYSQGINTMMKREVNTRIALSEVPYVMRAMGFYPSEQEVEDMLNEVKFSRYVETGEDVTDINLEDFIKREWTLGR